MNKLSTSTNDLTDCLTCHAPVTNTKATAHIGSCFRKATRARIILRARGCHSSPTPHTACLVKAETLGYASGSYSAYFMVRTDQPLHELDAAIRNLWMEPCCPQKHPSWFLGDHRDNLTIPMQPPGQNRNISVYEAWSQTRSSLQHIFDSHDPTKCYLTDYALYEAPWEDPVRLLAANQQPTIRCSASRTKRIKYCNEPATVATTIRHPHRDHTYRLYACSTCAHKNRLPWRRITNSPRSGSCNYATAFPLRQRTSLPDLFPAAE